MRDLLTITEAWAKSVRCYGVENAGDGYLYHATPRKNLASIMANGLLASRYGAIHGSVIAVLKPFWRFWLTHPRGGEVSYAGNIPPEAIHA